jgi:cytochrome c-type biogenesis protein CcmH/NrfG
MRERLEAERAALAEAIRVAEEAEDDEKVDELLREMQKLDKKLG